MKEAIRDLGADRKAQKPLEDLVDRLENETKDLKARLTKLEAKGKIAEPAPAPAPAPKAAPKRAAKKK